MFRKLLVVAAAIAMPVSVVAVSGGVAGAGKPPPHTGTITCPIAITASVNPPLVKGGTPGKIGLTTLPSTALSGCSSASGVTGGTTGAAIIKSKGVKSNPATPKVKYIADCSTLASAGIGGFKQSITWADGTKSKIAYTGGTTNLTAPIGFTLHGTATGSFAGPVTVTADISSGDIAAFAACVAGSGTVAAFHIVAPSSITVG